MALWSVGLFGTSLFNSPQIYRFLYLGISPILVKNVSTALTELQNLLKLDLGTVYISIDSKTLGAVHKLCRLKGAEGGEVKNCQFYLVKRRLRGGRGSKIANFETT